MPRTETGETRVPGFPGGVVVLGVGGPLDSQAEVAGRGLVTHYCLGERGVQRGNSGRLSYWTVFRDLGGEEIV